MSLKNRMRRLKESKPVPVRKVPFVFIWLFFGGCSLITILLAGYVAWEEIEYAESMQTTGTIIDKGKSANGRGNGYSYYFDYRYKTQEGEAHSGRTWFAGRDSWESTPIGSSCQVMFLPNHPERSRLAETCSLECIVERWIFSGFLATFGSFCALFPFYLLRRRRQVAHNEARAHELAP